MSIHQKQSLTGIELIIGVLILIALFCRIFFGVDFTDESQYVAQAILPLVNGSYFKNDLFIQQLVYLFISPLIRVYVESVKFEGIYLFLRLLYLSQALLCGFLVFKFSRVSLGSRLSFYLALTLLAFIPFSIPSISYNNSVFHLLPVIALYLIFSNVRSRSLDLFVSFLILLLIMSYPPVLVAILLLLFLRMRDSFLEGCLLKRDSFIVICLILNVLVGFYLLSLIGFKDLNEALKFSSRFTDTSFLSKSKSILLQYFKFLPYLTACFLFKLLMRKFKKNKERKFQKIEIAFFLLVYVIAVFKFKSHHTGHLFITVTFIFFLFYEISHLDHIAKKIVVPLGFAALICSYFSSNRIVNSCIPLVIPTIFLLDRFERRTLRTKFILPAFVIVLAISNYWFVYGDANFLALNTKITSGPFKNLITTKENAILLIELEAELSSSHLKGSKLLSLHFPAIYTFGLIRPETRMLYIHDATLKEEILRSVFDGLKPKYLFIFTHKNQQVSAFAFATFCRAACRLVSKTQNYELYQTPPL